MTEPSIHSHEPLAFERPLTSVDVAIFSVRQDKLQVLLVQRVAAPGEPYPGQWALPGGFVDVRQDDTLQACALRKLREKTGVQTPYLEQLGSWGGASRDPRGWSTTHAYFALIAAEEVELRGGGNSQDVRWAAVEDLHAWPLLAFDHTTILQVAVQRLQSKVEYTSLPVHLLAEPFTLPQLQKAYEIVLGRPVDKSGFRTRMLAAGFLQEAGEVDVGAPRVAMAYRLRDPAQLVFFPRTFSPRTER